MLVLVSLVLARLLGDPRRTVAARARGISHLGARLLSRYQKFVPCSYQCKIPGRFEALVPARWNAGVAMLRGRVLVLVLRLILMCCMVASERFSKDYGLLY